MVEIQGESRDQAAAWIACPAGAIPDPGQYLLAWSPADGEAALGAALFLGQKTEQAFLAAPPIPRSWEPGTALSLRGPLGQGFHLPPTTRRLALAAVGASAARLLPLIPPFLAQDTAVTLFTGARLPALPAELEVYPLQELPGAIAWADFLALDLPLESLPQLRPILGLSPGERLACPAQALVVTGMPCAGLAECGACAVPGRRNWKLACKDGPVFDLNEMAW